MQAHDLARQALDLSRDIENEWGVGIAQRALGRIALARRKVTDAARHLHEALDTFDAVHARYDAARTHLDLATLASTQGEPESAATHLSTAYAWFKQLQVPKWVEKTEQRAHEYGISLTDVTLRRMPDGKSHICCRKEIVTMGEILGIGVTHYPPLLSKPETYANLMRIVLTSPMVPPEMRQPANWPEPMQEEYAHEAARAVQHQERMVEAFRQVRRAIDDFGPDAVIIFGDDQYENFKEDCIPPFCVFMHDRMESRPFAHGLLGFGGENNVWGEPVDATFVHRGDKPLAKHIATELMEQDFPISYAFTNSHHAEQHGPTELTHAFLNALLYLDWDRKGFDYPVVPIQVNAYGKDVVPNRGVIAHLDPKTKSEPFGDELGPPAPSADSCARLGGLLRDILEARAGKYVIMASSGWSHAFLTEKHHWLYPDIAADREHLEELRLGQHPRWAHLTHAQIDAAGDHEFRNWICLAGAMQGYRADIVDYLETYIFNSNKCFAILRDGNRANGQTIQTH